MLARLMSMVSISFEIICLTENSSVMPALQDLNMKIEPGQRIGIRGRTGR